MMKNMVKRRETTTAGGGPDHGKTRRLCYAKYIEYKIQFSNGSGITQFQSLVRCPVALLFTGPIGP
jgi:hypothetical protein